MRSLKSLLVPSHGSMFAVAFALCATGCLATESVPDDEIGTAEQSLVVPGGFSRISSGLGVAVYQNSSGSAEYVTVVDLRSGSLRSLTGPLSGPLLARQIGRKPIQNFWWDAQAGNTATRTAKVVLNGTFSMPQSPAPIALGLKVGGTVLSYGQSPNVYPGFLRVFMFDNLLKTCSIANYDFPNFAATYNSAVPDGMGALDPGANVSGQQNVLLPRTFVGVVDQNNDGRPEMSLFYSSRSATQASAQNVLVAFGAQAVAMCEGAGSAGLVVDGVVKISSGQGIPHALAVYAGR